MEVTYPDFGTFTDQDFYDYDYRPYVMLPQSPEALDPQFRLYTRENLKQYQILKYNNHEALAKSNFRPSRRTKLIIHGFLSNSEYDWIETIKETYLHSEDCNVIKVDWRNGNGMPYEQAVANARIVGLMVGKFIEMTSKNGAKLNSIHIIGESLGAHIAGYAGKYLEGKLGQITALDPAGPYFQWLEDNAARLWHTDAEFVEVIHTDGTEENFDLDDGSILSLGMNETCGHVDLFPNGGFEQPACLEKRESFAR